MSRLRKLDIIDPYCFTETSIFTPKPLTFPSFLLEQEFDDVILASDFFRPKPSPFDLLDTVTDLIQLAKTPSFCSYKRVQHRVGTELYLQSLCERVSELESRFERVVKNKKKDRRYSWTEEIKGGVDGRKYKWTAEIKGQDEKKKKKEERKYKWTAEIKGEDEILRKYTFEASSGDGGERSGLEKKDKKKKKSKGESDTRIVEIEDSNNDHGAIVLRQAFAKRAAVRTNKGKHKELSPQDAALLIQMTFRAYLIRRSQALRALRELAIAKAKLKEIRALFNNFSYRRQVARDAEERQRFSEKIIVLFLTVDAIEGYDLMVRAAKKSMVDELEAMLDAVDPQPPGKLLSIKRRTFDMPDGVIRKEIAEGVAQVVKMINDEED